MEYEELLELLKSRRTIRAIKPDPISDEAVDKILEAARWAPTGFNMQPLELLVVRNLELRTAIKTMVDDYKNNDFFPMEATREEWQGYPWTLETHGKHDLPLAPVFVFFLGDTRRKIGLPMPARLSSEKGGSIFESSLSNGFAYAWLAAHSLGLAACPISAVKYPKLQGLVKHVLNLPAHIELYDGLLIGHSAMEGPLPARLVRSLDEMVHHDRAEDDEFMSEAELKTQIKKLRAGCVAGHV
ncbi:MAG: nitroreductase family protein [Thermoleophilia bacterium]